MTSAPGGIGRCARHTLHAVVFDDETRLRRRGRCVINLPNLMTFVAARPVMRREEQERHSVVTRLFARAISGRRITVSCWSR